MVSEEEKELHFWLDDLHCPQPISPMWFDIGGWWYTCHYMYRRFGVPFGKDWVAKTVSGYLMSAVVPRPADEEAELWAYYNMVMPVYADKFLDWWKRRYLPEILRNFEYLDTFPMDTSSLPELMILLAIIGVTAAIVVPSIATRSRPFDMAESSRRLNSEIARMRARAIAEQRNFELVLDGGDTVTIEHMDGDDRVVERTETMPEGSGATLNGATSGTIVFYPTGRVSSAGNLVLSDGTSRHTVRVLASGMTRWITEQEAP